MKSKLQFSENLKAELKNCGVSQEKLAKELSTTQATVSRWCSGTNEPDFETLLKLCELLDVSPNVLLGWEE